MNRFNLFVVQCIFFSVCFCDIDISNEKKDSFLNGFIDYLNNLPNQPYTYEEGDLLSAQEIEEDYYKIETRLKVSELHNVDAIKYIKCTTTVQDLGNSGISVLNNFYHCLELSPEDAAQYASDLEEVVTDNPSTTEETAQRRPVQLDNEVEPNNDLTSGEQFIAIPRHAPMPCIGCATHVSPEAAGVSELAKLAVNHLDKHEPNVKHTLNTVHDVERQVQVVNGVRYILTMTVNYDNCTEMETETCLFNKSCKISILEKPWVRLADGSKYRAIVANNCTAEWLYGDNGEVISQNPDENKENNEININPFNNNNEKSDDAPKSTPDYDQITNSGSADDIFTIIHNSDLQGPQKQQNTLTNDELKDLQDQIVPHSQFGKQPINNDGTFKDQSQNTKINTKYVGTVETVKYVSNHSIPDKKPSEEENTGFLSEDKKKAIDDMINFFNFAGLDTKTEVEDNLRLKRSYESDLKVMSLAEKYERLKRNIKNAELLYKLGQTMVDYLNEMDLELKTRTLKDVFNAEEEIENNQHFFYIQAHVVIPCDKAECESKDTENKICNAVIDNSNPRSPQIMNAFCYNEEKKKSTLGSVKSVPFDDPVLLKLTNDSIKKIESELSHPNAMRVKQILTANTQKVSGTLTKISFVLEFTNCTKAVSLTARVNCTGLEYMGTKLCEVEIHERNWLKEKQIMYSCTDRPIDETFTNVKFHKSMNNFNNPKITEITQEALQHLEIQSNRNNKQKIVKIKSVSTQIVAGLLTDVEFTVGYTECTNDMQTDVNSCKLLDNEQLRQCKAQVWERPWLEDGRQVSVMCNDKKNDTQSNEVPKIRNKRSSDLNFVGGQAEHNPNDPKFIPLAEESLQKFLQTTGNTQQHKVVKIKMVTTQVVSGSLTRLNFDVLPTNCQLDNNTQPSSDCQVQNSTETLSCYSEIWERSWLKSKEIAVNCSTNHRILGKSKRHLIMTPPSGLRSFVGGFTDRNPKEPQFMILAQEAMQEFIRSHGITDRHEVLLIDRVATQVVNGINTKMDFKMAPGSCKCETDPNKMFHCHAEIYEPFTSDENRKEIQVDCVMGGAPSNKPTPGGMTYQDPNQPEYKKLAEESMNKYLQVNGITKKHRVIQIEKVTTQVVSGSMTKIDFKIAPDHHHSQIYDCHSEIWEQPWLNRKEIKVTCTIGSMNRSKRQIMGGLTDKDPKDPKYKKLAEQSLAQYLQTSGNNQHHAVVEVVKVTTQVVSGSLTRIDFKISPTDCHLDSNGQPSSTSNCKVQDSADVLNCYSKVWEQSWLNKKEIDINCAKDGASLTRSKRQIKGGQTEQDPNDDKYRHLAEESLAQYLQTSGNNQHHAVVEVVKVTTQVVSGSMTRIDFKISPTNCQLNTNGQPSSSSNCEVQNSADVLNCYSVIWEQPWLNKKEIDINCAKDGASLKRSKRQVPGGLTEQDPSDSKYRQLAEESLAHYLRTSGNNQHHAVVEVVKVTTQVVSGSLTRIDFKISPTYCLLDGNGQLSSSSNCKVQNSADVLNCYSKIWEQSWLNKKEIDINCAKDGASLARSRRQIPGGLTEQDPNDDKYRQLAEESLSQYLQTSRNNQHHAVVEVVKVTTQVVSGSLTRIDFKISPTNCLLDGNGQLSSSSNCKVQNSADVLNCYSKIWEQSWLNKKEIDINCAKDGASLARSKRQIPGGLTEQDPNDDKYRQLAEESLAQYLQTSGNNQHQAVVEVVKVTTQVVSGSLTRIDFKISPTNCLLESNGQLSSSSNCKVQNSADVLNCYSKIWEQSWLNKKEIDINCAKDGASLTRSKRQIAGGLTEQDPNDEKYRHLADESLAQYLQTSGNKQHHVVVQIVKVTTQVVSGSLTRVDFKISPTNCHLDSNGQPSSTSNCKVQDSADVLNCYSKIWEQSWLNKKEIDINCAKDGASLARSKRQISGGLTDQDPNDDKYRQLAEESLAQYLQTSGNNQHHAVVEVVKVTTQVVSGSLTRIDFKISPTNCQLDSNGQPSSTSNCKVQDSADVLNCYSKIWEQSWLNKKEIDINCAKDGASLTRSKRQIKGGQTEQDPNNDKYRHLAEESLAQYLQTSGNNQHHAVVEVVKVTTQVVSGSMTRIDFKISPTNCQLNTNGQPSSSSNCEVQNSADVLNCYSVIWEQPWLNKKEIDINCAKDGASLKRSKRQVPGGLTEQDPSDSKYRQLAEESLAHYLRTSGNNQHHAVVEVVKVTTQVVSGSLTRIDFKISPTNCLLDGNGQLSSSSNCKVQNSADVLNCYSKIWEQSWLNKKEIDINCAKDGASLARSKRQIPGGLTEQDPNDDKYRQLAEESLAQYLQTSGNNQHHAVVEVVKVTTQVVSGSLTRIDFKISPTNCLLESNGQLSSSSNCKVQNSADVLNCYSKIWEQSWLNKKEIDINCAKDGASLTRSKRQIAGGLTEQDPNDEKYRNLADESLAQYLQTSGNKQHHIVVQIVKVTTQVVSGSLTRVDFKISPTNCHLDSNGQQSSTSNCKVQDSADVLNCYSKIWEQSWLNKKEIDINCAKDGASLARSKRQIPGGLTEQDPNDDKYRQLAEDSLAHYLRTSGNNQHHAVVEVVKVSTQVVSGSLTRIDFKISPTNCLLDSNGQPSSTSNCKVQDSADVLNCYSKIWEQSWLNKKEIDINCAKDGASLTRSKRQIAGGLTEQDPNEDKYRQLADESLAQYLQTSGNNQHHAVVEVVRVTTQVVSGSLIRIDFKVSPTNCHLDSNWQPSSSKCEVRNPAEVYYCHSNVLDQPWLSKRVIDINCTILDNHTVRKNIIIAEGIANENVNEEKFKALAIESLYKYLLNTGNKRFYKLVEIENVTTQVVTGTFTTIDFKISSTNCEISNVSQWKNMDTNCEIEPSNMIHCRSKVWERPWLKDDNSKLIDVSCNDLTKRRSDADSKIETSSELAWSGTQTEEDPSKYEFQILAEESLREYQKWQKVKAHHKVEKVNRVVTQVISGMKYKIDFTALRQMWHPNEVHIEHEQKGAVMLRCHSEVWDRPWLNIKEIEVNCNVIRENEEDSKQDIRIKRSLGGPQEMDATNNRYKQLAAEAIQKYQKRSKATHLYRLNKIHRVTEQVVVGLVTNIFFTISPTICLVSETQDPCELQEPKIILKCSAEIRDPPLPQPRNIKINCINKRNNKENVQTSRQKRDEVVVTREKRQLDPDDDYVEEEMKYYYADRAISDYNSRIDTNNLFKAITIHDINRSVQMKTLMVRMYIELAMTYCLRNGEEADIHNCDEIEGMNHKLCLARLWPSPDDEMVVQQVSMVCDDEKNFEDISGISVIPLINASLKELEKSPKIHYKLGHQGEANVVPTLNYRLPIRISFVVVSTNCTKDVVDPVVFKEKCALNMNKPAKTCTSYIYLKPNTRSVHHIDVSCNEPKVGRNRRSVSLDPTNATTDELMIQKMVQESIDKLEMASMHKYKQRVLVINSYSSKIVTGKLTTIDFDVGYTTCLKYEWVQNVTSCEFLEHLPRRHCVSQIWERLWINNGRHIDVDCEDDETPLEAHIEFESAENAMQLAREALKHIEAKYPHPNKQKIVRIFSLEKQVIAGLHYRMKVEVGITQCVALSIEDNCKLIGDSTLNKFCRVNVWLRPWTDHPPSYRVSCDYQDTSMADLYYQMQSEMLFMNFIKTYKPVYMDNHVELQKRFEIFKANVRKIHELNIYERGTARYAVTRFTDLSEEEFSKNYLGLKPSLRDDNQVPMRMATIPNVAVPEKFDWRDFNTVTEVKDQGSCGSCWAFSVTGNIEGQWKMQSGKLVSLSEQELVDCDKLDNGCSGGLPDNAYRAIEQLGGLEEEADYPYEGENDKCIFNKTLARVQITGAVNISSNETKMAMWLVQNGPISIGINANAMQFYVGGVSHPWKMLCNPSNLDHGVLIVGFGVKDYPLFHKRLPYWIVKNSWGKSWGEQGYYRVYRGDGTCGVNMMASSAVI